MCTLEQHGRVFILTLTGDGEHRFNHDLISSIRSALSSLRSTPSTPTSGAALVTVADGRFFSNGLDLAWATQGTNDPSSDPTAFRSRLGSLVDLFRPLVADLLSLPMPTIAAVTGHAAAAGLLLALSHDYALMRGDRGVLYMSELDIGLPFPPYFMEIMKAKISNSRGLRDVALASRKLRASDALELGIVDRVCVDAAETRKEAVKLAEELAGRNWDGGVYVSMRMSMFPAACKAVGLVGESDEEKSKWFASKL